MSTNKIEFLFLVTGPPSAFRHAFPRYEDWSARLTDHGANVHLRSWRDETLDIEELSKFDRITFLWCINYHEHGGEFARFLLNRLKPAQQKSPGLVVVNDTDVVHWNMEKAKYLVDLKH